MTVWVVIPGQHRYHESIMQAPRVFDYYIDAKKAAHDFVVDAEGQYIRTGDASELFYYSPEGDYWAYVFTVEVE